MNFSLLCYQFDFVTIMLCVFFGVMLHLRLWHRSTMVNRIKYSLSYRHILVTLRYLHNKNKEKVLLRLSLCTVWEYVEILALQGVLCELYNHICAENANKHLLDVCLYHNTYIWYRIRLSGKRTNVLYSIEICVQKINTNAYGSH